MKSLPPNCEQCLHDFGVALEDLSVYVQRARKNDITESQSRDLISNFEVAHELALKLINKYFHKQGKGPFSGSRDATVEAFHADLIDDGKVWLDMIIDRIQYNPVYPLDTQAKFLTSIQHSYIHSLEKFEEKMTQKLEEIDG